MRTATKTWLIIAFSLVLIGCIIWGVVMDMLKWDFSQLSTNTYETNRHAIHEDFSNITIVADTAGIIFVPSENTEAAVICHEQKNARHSVKVVNDSLVIEVEDSRKWYEHIGIHTDTPKITVSVPQGEYGTLSIHSSTGSIEIPEAFRFESMDIAVSTGSVTSSASVSERIAIKASTGSIRVDSISAGSLALSVSTGKVTVSDVTCRDDVQVGVSTGKADLTNISCKNLTSTGDTGSIILTHVIAAGAMYVERSTGDVKLNGCDAAELLLVTDTGDITGSLLSEKVFLTHTDTGRVNVPQTATGGKCELRTDTGDIKITIQ